MTFITLELAKKHLRVDWDDEDDLIEFLIPAAQSAAIKHLNRAVYADQAALDAADDPDGIVIGENIKFAMLLLLDHMYVNRGAVLSGPGGAPHELPLGVLWLLRQDRKVPGV